MSKSNFKLRRWEPYDRARFRRTKYHEAGHSVPDFILGHSRDTLVHFRMKGDMRRFAYVRHNLTTSRYASGRS